MQEAPGASIANGVAEATAVDARKARRSGRTRSQRWLSLESDSDEDELDANSQPNRSGSANGPPRRTKRTRRWQRRLLRSFAAMACCLCCAGVLSLVVVGLESLRLSSLRFSPPPPAFPPPLTPRLPAPLPPPNPARLPTMPVDARLPLASSPPPASPSPRDPALLPSPSLPPGYVEDLVAARLNARYARGYPSAGAEGAGVFVSHFDARYTPRPPVWLPCATTAHACHWLGMHTVSMTADAKFSLTVMNRALPGQANARLPGVVLATSVVGSICALSSPVAQTHAPANDSLLAVAGLAPYRVGSTSEGAASGRHAPSNAAAAPAGGIASPPTAGRGLACAPIVASARRHGDCPQPPMDYRPTGTADSAPCAWHYDTLERVMAHQLAMCPERARRMAPASRAHSESGGCYNELLLGYHTVARFLPLAVEAVFVQLQGNGEPCDCRYAYEWQAQLVAEHRLDYAHTPPVLLYNHSAARQLHEPFARAPPTCSKCAGS